MGGAPHMVPLYPTGDVLCPVRALRWHTQRVVATESQPLFMWLNARKAPTPMTHRILVQRLKAGIAAIGMDPTAYSGHSLR